MPPRGISLFEYAYEIVYHVHGILMSTVDDSHHPIVFHLSRMLEAISYHRHKTHSKIGWSWNPKLSILKILLQGLALRQH